MEAELASKDLQPGDVLETFDNLEVVNVQGYSSILFCRTCPKTENVEYKFVMIIEVTKITIGSSSMMVPFAMFNGAVYALSMSKNSFRRFS